ncbi:Spo0E family sporulation regulatory protein-aspartic acid phosphatase [Bacillus atrophaeus]|uniref:Spo0E family sporulation regulatory protein-aspartic acid phosphatase n=1 Tax=Bacillus atrophaeus TaxID=1452 RepID=UPI003F5CEC94
MNSILFRPELWSDFVISEAEQKELLKNIEITREKMILSAVKKGRVHPDTIRLSEALDVLLNQYHADRKGD